MERHINVPFDADIVKELKAGDYVYLTGTIYTARDAAHKRMYEALQNGETLPFDIEGNVIYYKAVRLDQQVRQQQVVWINIRRHFLSLACVE